MAEKESNPALHLLAPALAFGATMVMRQVIKFGYQRMTGKSAPNPLERRTPLASALIWAATTAAATAVVEVAIYRMAGRD